MFFYRILSVIVPFLNITILESAYAKTTFVDLISAGTNLEKGEKIAREMDIRDQGFKNVSSKMTMTLSDGRGTQTNRTMRTNILETNQSDAGDKSLVIFDNPRDIAGTALLSYAMITEADEQWLYLPALKRVKRISSRNKSGPFMGSEFSYEDITGNEVRKYSWEYIETLPCPNMPDLECAKLKSIPKYEESGYTKRFYYMDTQEFRPMVIEYYDRKDELLKTQIYSQYQLYENKFWRASVWDMNNVQTKKTTKLEFLNYDFKTPMDESDFTKSALGRAL